MGVIRHQMPFLNLAFLLRRRVFQQRTQMLPELLINASSYISEPRLVVLTFPFCVIDSPANSSFVSLFFEL